MSMRKEAGRQRTAVRRNSAGTQYVVEGNTVRAVRQEAVLRHAQAQREQRRRQLLENERRRENAVYAQKQRALSLDLPYLLVLLAAVLIIAAIFYNYLSLKSDIDQNMNSVKTLEVQLENLRTENDALEQSIDTSVDLNHVYEVAVNELGMIHAGKNNVIQYDKTESEYVRQNEDIPKN